MSNHPYDEKTVARFWSKVNKNGPVPAHCPELGKCWVWTASTTKHGGYGQMQLFQDGKYIPIRAHRFAWIVANGEIPAGFGLMHCCDNARCVNATHLKVATQLENIQDAASKHRLKLPNLKGDKHPQAKLTEAQILEARKMFNGKHGDLTRIAKHFGIGLSQASRIVGRQAWKHVP